MSFIALQDEKPSLCPPLSMTQVDLTAESHSVIYQDRPGTQSTSIWRHKLFKKVLPSVPTNGRPGYRFRVSLSETGFELQSYWSETRAEGFKKDEV